MAEDLTGPEVVSRTTRIVFRVPRSSLLRCRPPVDRARRPDLTALKQASEMVGQRLRRVQDDPAPIITYEFTVYPGCTGGLCVAILEAASGLRCGVDFTVGYSLECMNPGDPEHSIDRVVKVVAGQDAETLERVAIGCEQVVLAGVYRAPDTPTAEVAKAIESVQRDLNIALMNELAILFHRKGINAREVLKAGQTNWNALPFQPSLVNGHCIPVDPY